MWRIKNKAGSTAETYDQYGSVPKSWKGMNRTAKGKMQSNKEKRYGRASAHINH